jgi:hypothetical protein
LDRGIRDEDLVIAPEVPGCSAVRQGVLNNQPDGQALDAARVEGLGQGLCRQVSGEAAVADAATVSGEGDVNLNGTTGLKVAQVKEAA